MKKVGNDKAVSYLNGWKKFGEGLEDVLVWQMHNHKEIFEEFVTEQLYSGVNGDEAPLRPTYTQDPYFKENYGENWKKRAEGYKKWKKKIQPPARSYLGFRPRAMDTPNLIIRGDFYASITAVPIADGVSIVSQGLMFSSDIENKYGNVIYKISDKAKRHYITFYMTKRIKEYMKACGV